MTPYIKLEEESRTVWGPGYSEEELRQAEAIEGAEYAAWLRTRPKREDVIRYPDGSITVGSLRLNQEEANEYGAAVIEAATAAAPFSPG